jgi:hypothetical protein
MLSRWSFNHNGGIYEIERFALNFVILSADVLKLLARPEEKFFTYEYLFGVGSFGE